jgi:pimeloyl-ACP methyl ester carboxylesterase
MHRALITILLMITACCINAPAQEIPYGDNAAVGRYIELNGVRHYYEVYGEGKPLLLIHGNATGIKGWAPQIAYFSKRYKVFAIDCRGRGKSDLGKDSLTYLQQAKDMAAFISALHIDSVAVVGKSDGGIIAIMLGMYYPAHIERIVSFSANMWPDSTALYSTTIKEMHAERILAERMLAKKDTTKNWHLIQQRNRMMEFQPHITVKDLHKIQVPVLVISTDRDVIKEEHTFFIYKNIPHAHLCFLAGETHHVPKQNPALFNEAVEKFLSEPYRDDSYRFH